MLSEVSFNPREVHFNQCKVAPCKVTLHEMQGDQWRIQDFTELAAPTPKVDVKSYYLANFSKKRMKLKEFGPGGGILLAPP